MTIPRITHEGRILEIKVKLSQVIVTDLGPAKSRRKAMEEILAPMFTGEIERGSVDGEEEVDRDSRTNVSNPGRGTVGLTREV